AYLTLGWDRDTLLAQTPLQSWQEELPATPDYQVRTENLPAPTDLKPGFYALIASHDSSFTKKDNRLSYTRIWVSDLALVVREIGQQGRVEGFVLNAESGEPQAGARVRRFDTQSKSYIPNEDTLTDSNGMFSFLYAGQRQYFVMVAELKDQRLASQYTYRTDEGWNGTSINEQTVLFTDRSLYRPGQSIHYKGICLRRNPDQNDYGTLSDQQVTVVFRDTNGQEIERRTHRCNDYGSFSGNVTAPHDRLLGRMSLIIEKGPGGSASIDVEEYKRPTFRVELATPDLAPRLNDEVTVPGTATAYTGAAVGNARVAWRVERQVRFPLWCWWARWAFPDTAAQIMGHGTTVTAADGSFSVPFMAKPDLAVPESYEPTFNYRIVADVTDTTGETRTQTRTLRIGYTALSANITVSQWQTPHESIIVTVDTTSLDGEAEPAAGTLLVYRLQQPAHVQRDPLSSISTWRYVNNGAPDVDPTNPDTWELGEQVTILPFQTDALGQTQIEIDLPAGIYRTELETQDRFGVPVQARHTLYVIDPEALQFTVKVPDFIAAPHWSVEPGTSFKALWGTGYDAGRAYIELEKRGEVLRAYWTDTNRTQELIEEPVTEDMRGGFTLRITFVRENRAYIREHIVDVPWTNKKLSMRWERFRNLLEPGDEDLKEQWTAVITGSDARAAVAEMVATLYDASLDQF
ncbi:MG2 domain-containing protein, partial [Planctomycetota bacterium]